MWLAVALLWALAGCPTGADDDDSVADCSSEDVDGDGLDGCAEQELGSDPDNPDTDGDGLTDGEEADCVSDPTDAAEQCYACGWAHNDPHDLVAGGGSVGEVIANIPLEDQCLEPVPLWDFYGEYHILWMTASW